MVDEPQDVAPRFSKHLQHPATEVMDVELVEMSAIEHRSPRQGHAVVCKLVRLKGDMFTCQKSNRCSFV